jgi:hypothetical protein
MASFKDKFLRDLEDLSDEEEEVKKEEVKSGEEESGESADEDMDFAEYQEREDKVDKLISKGYQSKIRNDVD